MFVIGCGGGDAATDTDASTTQTTLPTTMGTSPGTSEGTDTAGETETSAGPGSDAASDSDATSESETNATSDTDPTEPTDSTDTSNPTDPSTTDPTEATTDGSTTEDPPECGNGVLEEGEECDDGDQNDNNACSNSCTKVACEDQEMGGGQEVLSYIWIANSSQGTVSKINTQTMEEEGRYIVRPDSNGNPSRTSVALNGDVVVANRAGGIVKIFSNTEDCVESNGMPDIQTSSGGNDILPWGTEECIAWYQPFDYQTQRPVTWTQGELNEDTCEWENPKVWTSGRYGAGTADVLLLDGETGVVEGSAQVPSVGWAGLYGGSVDGDGNFWTVDHHWSGPSTLVRVDRLTLEVSLYPVEGQVHYGLAVDAKGRPWLCGNGGASRFDPMNLTWQHLQPPNGGNALGGCMTDGNGTLWQSRYPNAVLVGIDTETLQVVDTINIPNYVHGVSIDFEGNVWGVTFGSSEAYRVNPQTHEYDTFSGLVGAYTYSDMTGFALSSAGTIE